MTKKSLPSDRMNFNLKQNFFHRKESTQVPWWWDLEKKSRRWKNVWIRNPNLTSSPIACTHVHPRAKFLSIFCQIHFPPILCPISFMQFWFPTHKFTKLWQNHLQLLMCHQNPDSAVLNIKGAKSNVHVGSKSVFHQFSSSTEDH